MTCVIPRCWATYHFLFALLLLWVRFFAVLGSDFLRRSLKIAKRDYWLRYVCPSVRPQEKNSASTGLILMKFGIWLFFFFGKSVESLGFIKT